MEAWATLLLLHGAGCVETEAKISEKYDRGAQVRLESAADAAGACVDLCEIIRC
jgi:hypothetical protein